MTAFPFPSELTERVQSGALVVSGSRSFAAHVKAPWAREQVAAAVKLALARGWCVVVGDAFGVDSYAIVEAYFQGVPVIVLGCEAVGRLRTPAKETMLTWLVPGGDRRGSCFVVRDEALCVLASLAPASGFYGVWDGVSRGTLHTAGFAKRYGVPGVLVSREGRETWSAQ
jgi:hypothetical protein